MMKIMAYESDFTHLWTRYGSLHGHDVHVRLLGELGKSFEARTPELVHELTRFFPLNNIKPYNLGESPDEADFYFVGGSKEEALAVLPVLPRGKAFWVTDNEVGLESTAAERRYATCRGQEITKIIEEMF